eukprot:2512358-Amphidinium_carterae.1
MLGPLVTALILRECMPRVPQRELAQVNTLVLQKIGVELEDIPHCNTSYYNPNKKYQHNKFKQP